jgi:plastocyanin
VLDTDQRFSTTLTTAGTYDYFCSLHPKVQGKLIVRR